jgi:ribosomal protein L11 methyltransferase
LPAPPLDQTPDNTYELIAANIIAQVIVDVMPDIERRMAKNGIAILSGIIQERKPDVIAALKACHLNIIHEINEGDWVALAVNRKGN